MNVGGKQTPSSPQNGQPRPSYSQQSHSWKRSQEPANLVVCGAMGPQNRSEVPKRPKRKPNARHPSAWQHRLSGSSCRGRRESKEWCASFRAPLFGFKRKPKGKGNQPFPGCVILPKPKSTAETEATGCLWPRPSAKSRGFLPKSPSTLLVHVRFRAWIKTIVGANGFRCRPCSPP